MPTNARNQRQSEDKADSVDSAPVHPDELAHQPMTVALAEGNRDWDVTLEWDEEGEGWVTFVPVLNNISTFGYTPEEALDRTREAIRGYVVAAAKRGIHIPEREAHERLPQDGHLPSTQTTAV